MSSRGKVGGKPVDKNKCNRKGLQNLIGDRSVKAFASWTGKQNVAFQKSQVLNMISTWLLRPGDTG